MYIRMCDNDTEIENVEEGHSYAKGTEGTHHHVGMYMAQAWVEVGLCTWVDWRGRFGVEEVESGGARHLQVKASWKVGCSRY